MLRCSPEAFAKCSTRQYCGSREEATFAEGSECAKFNLLVTYYPMTNGDRLRSMSDEELAKFLLDADQGNLTVDICDPRWCVPEGEECTHDCTQAVIKWLKSPVEERR